MKKVITLLLAVAFVSNVFGMKTEDEVDNSAPFEDEPASVDASQWISESSYVADIRYKNTELDGHQVTKLSVDNPVYCLKNFGLEIALFVRTVVKVNEEDHGIDEEEIVSSQQIVQITLRGKEDESKQGLYSAKSEVERYIFHSQDKLATEGPCEEAFLG